MYLYINVSSSLFHTRDYIQTHCNNRRNTFHFAYHQWYSNTNNSLIIFIFV